MANKKETGKKSGFVLAPITLSEPVKVTDGFTNLVEIPAVKKKEAVEPQSEQRSGDDDPSIQKSEKERDVAKAAVQTAPLVTALAAGDAQNASSTTRDDNQSKEFALPESELLRILDADSVDEIYELSDVLRASSLKLYATLIRLADSRGRMRVKSHELMSKAGIKGIATLYKQERWLMDLKLLEKKAKPGPHDGSSYVVHKLERLPLPAEIYEKFDEYLSGLK